MASQHHAPTGFTHLVDVVQRPTWLHSWEKQRHGRLHWLVEGVGESLGAFFYVYCGVGSTIAYIIGNLTNTPIGSFFTVGVAYAMGIMLAIAICGPVSGGHFNPCVSIVHAIWHGFPWRKVPVYIAFQILGAYIGCLMAYGQYRSTLLQIEELLIATGKYDAIQFTPSGIAGIFALYAPANVGLGQVFMNEFFVCFFLGLVIWGVMDPTNFFTPPAAVPWVVGFAYGCAIWGYAPGALALNTARDVGGRLMALTIWGVPAAGGKYAAIAALTNIPATILSSVVYELFLTDSSRVVPQAQLQFIQGHKAHLDHKSLGRAQDRSLDQRSHNSSNDGAVKYAMDESPA